VTGPPKSDSAPGRARNRRSEAARLGVLNAADDLLAEKGFGALTIEGIAARAGVAKQTIYRWWPSKVDILLDVLAEDAADLIEIRETGAAVDDFRRHLHTLVRFLAKPEGKVLLALMGEAQLDPEVSRQLADRHQDRQRRAEGEVLERGIEAGDLPQDLNVDSAIDALCGPLYYRAMTNRKIPRRFADELMDRWLGSMRQPSK